MTPKDMWNERLSFIWYNDREIFSFKEEDFDKLAKSYAESGITIVITFSSTHFRYSFSRHLDKIFACLKKLTDACHKYGIKVVEHASAHLTYNPLNEKDWEEIRGDFKTRLSSMDSWPGFEEFAADDDAVMNNGYKIREFRQINGRTGKWTRSPYEGYCFCFNNPYYRESYLMYLDEMYDRTGVDGYMADDQQYYEEGCACEHCRKLFKEETGYDLPYPEDWDEFYSNYENPAFVAWKKFKIKSIERFERDIYNHFLERGVKMLRPNYISSIILSNWSSHNFESASDLWDFVFQENCFASIIRYSFYDYMAEALQRYAMCEWKGSPSLSLFYPDRYDSFYFSWALSVTWGQLLLATAEGSHNTDFEKEFRTFEKEHKRLYTDPKKLSDITFYHSTKTRDLTDSRHNMTTLLSAIKCAYMAGYSLNMTFDYSRDEDVLKHKCIVCAGVAMVSDSELERFAGYAASGGKLIILGQFAIYKEDGSRRQFADIAAAFKDGFEKVAYLPEYDYTHGFGSFWAPRRTDPDGITQADFSSLPAVKAKGRQIFDFLFGEDKKVVSYAGTEADLLTGAFRTDGGYVVNITNITGCFPEGKAKISHRDTIPAFMKSAAKLDAFTVTLRITEKIEKAYLVSPEIENSVPLPFIRHEDRVEVVIPGGYFSGYAAVVLK
ncbi:MAG: hypothetical protein GX897_04555 [Clostridiales bacterium]|nr:hypothetical protein [Clostridiales bacterium]